MASKYTETQLEEKLQMLKSQRDGETQPGTDAATPPGQVGEEGPWPHQIIRTLGPIRLGRSGGRGVTRGFQLFGRKKETHSEEVQRAL